MTPPISTRLPFSLSLLFFSLITSSNAQIDDLPKFESDFDRESRKFPLGVIAVIVFVVIIIIVFILAYWRRKRRLGTPGIMPIGARPLKSIFGGRRERYNNIPPPPPQQPQLHPDSENNAGYDMSAGFSYNVPVHPPPIQEPYIPEHPRPTENSMPPPPYGTGISPSDLEQGGSYTPPPTPPPPAHTTGRKGKLAGGSKS